MNCAELARALKVCPETVNGWARGGRIPFDRAKGIRLYDLVAVCKALGIDPARVEAGEPEGAKAKMRAGRPRVVKDAGRVRFDQALHRIVRGDLPVGDVCAQLSIVTGIPYFDIRKRVDDVEYTYSDEEKSDSSDDCLSSGDLRTLVARYSKSKDPAVQAWVASIRRPAYVSARAKEIRAIDRLLCDGAESGQEPSIN